MLKAFFNYFRLSKGPQFSFTLLNVIVNYLSYAVCTPYMGPLRLWPRCFVSRYVEKA